MAVSLYQQARELEQQIGSVLSTRDIDELPPKQRELTIQLRNLLIDVRLDARDYEYAETRANQLNVVKDSKKRLDALRQTIIKASEYNVFSPVDVAELSARIEQLYSGME